MVYIKELLPTYLLHFSYGISLGRSKSIMKFCYQLYISGFPSILEPQLKYSPREGLILDSASEGLVVSLDYASTIVISMVAGQLQVRLKASFELTLVRSCVSI